MDRVKEYVVGFLFSDNLEGVLLIRKNRPDWQKGSLNGIGGHIEKGETPLAAMIREFKEEAGRKIETWKNLLVLTGADWTVHFFYTAGDLSLCLSQTDERLIPCDIEYLPRNCLTNLYWLIPMARYFLKFPEETTFAEISRLQSLVEAGELKQKALHEAYTIQLKEVDRLTLAKQIAEGEQKSLSTELRHTNNVNKQLQAALAESRKECEGLNNAIHTWKRINRDHQEMEFKRDQQLADLSRQLAEANRKLEESKSMGVFNFWKSKAEKAEAVWTELSTIVACTSPDGHVELEQVKYIQELLKTAESANADLKRENEGMRETIKRSCQMKIRCCFISCEKEAEFEIFDQNETRPDVGYAYACQDHVGHLLGSVPPTEPKRWTLTMIEKKYYECLECGNAVPTGTTCSHNLHG